MRTCTWLWVKDSLIRKAVITDDSITIYDENGKVILRVKNPSKSLKKQIVTEIQKHKHLSETGSNIYGSSKESIR